MASANDEETSLHHEERRLGLEIQRVELEERRLQLEQRRASLQAAPANDNSTQQVLVRPAPLQQAPVVVARLPPPQANDAPKILTGAELKEAAKANAAKKAPGCIGSFLRKVVPQDDNIAAVINNVDTRNAACNDANALRSREVVHIMEHVTMRKRKAEVFQDKGVQGKGVVDGKRKKVVGIACTEQTAMKNIKKYIPAAEQHE